MTSIVNFFKTSFIKLSVSSMFQGIDLLFAISIITVLLVFAFFIYLLVQSVNKSIKNEDSLGPWLKKIIMIYLIIINFSIIYTHMFFISDYTETLTSLNYYVPEQVDENDDQLNFIKKVNNFINENKNM